MKDEIIDVLKRFYFKTIKKYDSSDYNIAELRRKGCSIGVDCRFFTDHATVSEPWLIRIGEQTSVSTNVLFCTHDNSVAKIDYSDICGEKRNNCSAIFGRIEIGSNCLIGANSIIMYGVTIGDNSIIGAGSVVTKSIPENQVWAGNPAKYICSVEKFKQKSCDFIFDFGNLKEAETFLKKNPDKLVLR